MGRLQGLVATLERFYGVLPTPPSDPFAFFVWEMLSARTTVARRGKAFGALKQLRALTPDSLARAAPARLSAAVALAGPYLEDRLQALRAGADAFRRTPALAATIGGPSPSARRALKALPQLGPQGARRLLFFVAERATLPTDPGVVRAGRRLGFGRAIGATGGSRSVRQAMSVDLPRGDTVAMRRVFLYLSHHATAACTERDPRCRVCPLLDECPEGRRRAPA